MVFWIFGILLSVIFKKSILKNNILFYRNFGIKLQINILRTNLKQFYKYRWGIKILRKAPLTKL
ncbi:hypothetical protein YQ22_04855 [Maribacter sp. 1_2014MBL_MicDiv]|nr:hypothetical protein YQ22_04855 [Maribacter sp. 1_2014MBL_MicDiv]